MPEDSTVSTATSSMSTATGNDIRMTLPRICNRASWPTARFQIRNWLRLHDLISVVDDEVFDTSTPPNLRRNEKIFGVIASQCDGEALAIAQGMPEGDGRALFMHFDRLWRGSQPANLLVCVKTLTSSSLKEPNKFEEYLAERATASRRLAEGGMKLPEPFLALCLLIGLSDCPKLRSLQTIHALETTSEVELTVEKVTNAARQLLQVSQNRPDDDELGQMRKREQVLATTVRELEEQVLAMKVHVLKTDTQTECFYCRKGGHRAAECRKLKADYSKMNQADKDKWEKYQKVGVKLTNASKASEKSSLSMITELM